MMVNRLSDKEFTQAVTDITHLANAAFRWNDEQVEEVIVSRPLTKPELLGIKKSLPQTDKVQGIRFAKGKEDEEGLLFKAEDDQIMVAAKISRILGIRDRANYWSYSIGDYICWLLQFDVYTSEEARGKVKRLKGEFEDLLLAGLDRVANS